MLHKTFDLLDAKADVEAGTFEATVAVFGNVDKGGDRIQPGAFKNTLEKWANSGDPIPVILSHQWDNPMAHIGVVDVAKETDKGLWVKGTLDVADNEVAKQVHRLMARRSLKEFSFGYDVPKGGEKRAKDGANDLTEINLAELGPTLKGMNPSTELHSVKSALEATDEKQTDLESELQEVKARLDKLEKALENPEKKADVTDKEPVVRSVDPLRKRSEEIALEVASDGMSLHKPPKKAAEDSQSDLVPLRDLRQQSRDLMLELLS